MPRAGGAVRASMVVAWWRADGEAMRRFGLAATFAGGAVLRSPVLCACGLARPCVRAGGVRLRASWRGKRARTLACARPGAGVASSAQGVGARLARARAGAGRALGLAARERRRVCGRRATGEKGGKGRARGEREEREERGKERKGRKIGKRKRKGGEREERERRERERDSRRNRGARSATRGAEHVCAVGRDARVKGEQGGWIRMSASGHSGIGRSGGKVWSESSSMMKDFENYN